jgi:hypothetical protein
MLFKGQATPLEILRLQFELRSLFHPFAPFSIMSGDPLIFPTVSSRTRDSRTDAGLLAGNLPRSC